MSSSKQHSPVSAKGTEPDRKASGSRKRGISMRASLVLGFSAVLLLTAGGIILNGLYSARKVVRDLSTSLLEQTTDLAELKVQGVFGIVSRVNMSTALRIQNGLLTWQDWDAFQRFMLPMLSHVPQISGVGAGDSDGNAYNMVRFGNNWRSQVIRPSEWGTRTLWKEWTPDGEFLDEWWAESDFDPRNRPWFQGAIDETLETFGSREAAGDRLEPFWTSPYKFFTTGDYGVTVSSRIPWTNQLDAVVYFDIKLADLDEFVGESKPSPNGSVVLLNEALQIVGWPGRGAMARDKVLSGEGETDVTNTVLPHFAQALELWKARGEQNELMDVVSTDEGDVWLNFRSLPGHGTTFCVLTAIPEEDVLGEARKERQRLAIVFLVALLVAVGIAFWLASLYTRPIAALVERSEAIQRLDLAQRPEIVSRIGEVQRLSAAQASMTSALESFSRYVPRDVIAGLLEQGEAAKIGARPAELTVLFSDIRRFTAISETLSPDDVALYLSDYFEVLHGTIEQYQGTTDKFIGDAIMAFWGAPSPDENHACNAVRAALACRERLDDLNKKWVESGRPEFQTTFGLATGPVVVGNVGATTRLNYTVLGSTVNIASRCVGLGRQLGCPILALESVMLATADRIEWRRLGPVQVRGISQLTMVCEPLGHAGRMAETHLTFKRDYERALDAYLGKDFEGALELLTALKNSKPGELSVEYLLRRCEELKNRPATVLQTEMLSFS